MMKMDCDYIMHVVGQAESSHWIQRKLNIIVDDEESAHVKHIVGRAI